MFIYKRNECIFAVHKKIILWEEVIKKPKQGKFSKVHLESSAAVKPKKQLHKKLKRKLNAFFFLYIQVMHQHVKVLLQILFKKFRCKYIDHIIIIPFKGSDQGLYIGLICF